MKMVSKEKKEIFPVNLLLFKFFSNMKMKAEDLSMGFSIVALLDLIKIWKFYFQIIYLILSRSFK